MADQVKDENAAQARFEKARDKISKALDGLDDPETEEAMLAFFAGRWLALHCPEHRFSALCELIRSIEDETDDWVDALKADEAEKSAEFEDAAELAERYPETFDRPTEDDLSRLAPGDCVKVCRNGEWFWDP